MQLSRVDQSAVQDRAIPSIESDTSYMQHRPAYVAPQHKAAVIDLTTPEPQPRFYPPVDRSPPGTLQQVVTGAHPALYYGERAPAYQPYDPRQPALGMPQYAYRYPIPQPVHGAPAPVQMVVQPPRPPPPMEGAPHPAQPYRPR